MNWVILTLLSAFVWALVTIIDKFVSTKEVKDFLLASTVGAFGMSLLLLFLPLFAGSPFTLAPKLIFMGLLAGVIYRLATTFYYLALKFADASQVEPLIDSQPLFVLILSFFLFGERLGWYVYLGIMLVLIGSFMVSLHKVKGHFKIGKVLHIGLFAAFVYAVRNIVLKVATTQTDVWSLFFWIGIGQGVIAWLFLAMHHPHILKKEIQGVKHLLFNSLFNTTGLVLFTLALSKGPATLVSAVSLSCGFFVFSMEIILSFIFPKYWKEDLSWKTLLRRFFAMTLLVIGLVLIT
mgnify:CR=1 FL=1|jgi:bacterial/archaeal transporter family protein